MIAPTGFISQSKVCFQSKLAICIIWAGIVTRSHSSIYIFSLVCVSTFLLTKLQNFEYLPKDTFGQINISSSIRLRYWHSRDILQQKRLPQSSWELKSLDTRIERNCPRRSQLKKRQNSKFLNCLTGCHNVFSNR